MTTETLVRIHLPIKSVPYIDLCPTLTDEQMEMECFRNVYKDDNGFTPRGYTLEQARSYMDNRYQPTAEEIAEEDRRLKEENDRMEREMNESYAEWIAEEQQKRDDYGFLPWQVQAGRLRNLPETMILEY